MKAKGQNGRVLVVEDNFLMAEVVCDFLRDCDLEPVGPVGELAEAMELARTSGFDGAILDINLRGRFCFPVCSILLARRIPFIFLTGYGDRRLMIPSEFRGATFIDKPFEPSELKEVLAQMLNLTDDTPARMH